MRNPYDEQFHLSDQFISSIKSSLKKQNNSRDIYAYHSLMNSVEDHTTKPLKPKKIYKKKQDYSKKFIPQFSYSYDIRKFSSANSTFPIIIGHEELDVVSFNTIPDSWISHVIRRMQKRCAISAERAEQEMLKAFFENLFIIQIAKNSRINVGDVSNFHIPCMDGLVMGGTIKQSLNILPSFLKQHLDTTKKPEHHLAKHNCNNIWEAFACKKNKNTEIYTKRWIGRTYYSPSIMTPFQKEYKKRIIEIQKEFEQENELYKFYLINGTTLSDMDVSDAIILKERMKEATKKIRNMLSSYNTETPPQRRNPSPMTIQSRMFEEWMEKKYQEDLEGMDVDSQEPDTDDQHPNF